MDKKQAEQRDIIIWWWNFGKKTLDFKGTYKDYLIKRNIKVRKIKHPINKKVEGYRFNIPVGSSIINFDSFDSDYINCLTNAIKQFLTYLGDRTMFIDGYNREYKLNWR